MRSAAEIVRGNEQTHRNRPGRGKRRIIVATIAGDRLALEEVYRFPNGVVQVGDSLYWDVLRLWVEIKTGLRKVAAQHGREIRSLAVDTWGIDYALLDRRARWWATPTRIAIRAPAA